MATISLKAGTRSPPKGQTPMVSGPASRSSRGRSSATPVRLGDIRPAGGTANGIPLAYPAISHQFGQDAVPDAPTLCESPDKATAITGLGPVTRAGGTARRPGRTGERCWREPPSWAALIYVTEGNGHRWPANDKTASAPQKRRITWSGCPKH